MDNSIAKGYADALFEIAQESGKTELFREQCRFISETLTADFMRVLSHPKMSKTEKKSCIETVYGTSIDKIIMNFMKLMIDKNRFRYIKNAFAEFDADYRELNQILVAQVKSARALKEEDKVKIKEMLEKRSNQRVECTYEVDESLIAGLRIKLDDQILDNSAANQLARLREEVVNAA